MYKEVSLVRISTNHLFLKQNFLLCVMESRKALIITFEGGEGCGKTTQIKEFYPWFVKNYGKTERLKEPGGNPVAEKIRDILLSKKYNIDSLTKLFLSEAS